MKIFIFFALLGAAFALQYPLEYHYHYEGRLGTSIPGIRAQVSAMGIKSNLILKMHTKTQGIAQLTNVEVGTYHGDVKSTRLMKPIPIEYSPIGEYAKEFQEPFSVNFVESVGHVMTVGQEEEWITNIRKSILEILLIEPLIVPEDHSGSPKTEIHDRVFKLEEETIFGRCDSLYTLTSLPAHLSMKIKSEFESRMQEDVQKPGASHSRSSSVPSIDEQFWRVERSIDFSKCHDRVMLQHSGYGHPNTTGYSQQEAVESRSSVSAYTLQGRPGAFRVLRAMVEGAVVKNPFGFETEQIFAATNQSLVLTAVKTPTTPMRLPNPTKIVKTWQYEVVSPFKAPSGVAEPFVIYKGSSDRYVPTSSYEILMGKTMTPSYTQSMKSALMTLMDEAASQMMKMELPSTSVTPMSSSGSLILAKLSTATRIMTSLPVSDIENVFTQIYSKNDHVGQLEQQLIVDVMASCGTGPPMKVLLEKMRSGVLSKTRISSIFMTMTSQIVSPVVIPELMAYVKTVKLSTYEAPSIYVNFANMLHRVCLNQKAHNYSMPNPIYGQYICKPSLVINDFLPFLKEKLESTTKVSEQLIIIETLSYLGTEQSLRILTPIVMGSSNIRNILVRSAAMYALPKGKMPTYVRTEVMHILLGMIDDLKQPSELRQAAIAVLVSWEPEAVIFQRLARHTWRESDQQVAAFISFTIDSIARSTFPHHQSQSVRAMSAKNHMKPYAPSMRHSFDRHMTRTLRRDKLTSHSTLAWILGESSVPKEIYGFLGANYGGLTETMAEIAVASEGLEPYIYKLLDSAKSWSYTDPRKRGSVKSEDSGPEMSILAKYLGNVIQYMPLDKTFIKEHLNDVTNEILRKLSKGMKFQIAKYISPFTNTYFLPTEIGVPLVSSSATPMLHYQEGEIQLRIPGKTDITFHDLFNAERVYLLFKTFHRSASKSYVTMGALVPWSDKVVYTEIENVRELNLPIYGNVSLVNEMNLKNLTINLSPYKEAKFPVVYAHNIPFTGIYNLKNIAGTSDMKVISENPPRTPLTKTITHSDKRFTGIDATLLYEGDVSSPYTSGYMMDYLRKPQLMLKLFTSPTSRLWKTYISMSPSTSQSKNVSLSCSLYHRYQLPTSGSYQSQESGPSNYEFTPMDTMEQRNNKFKQYSKNQLSAYLFSTQLMFNSTEFRIYEALTYVLRQPNPAQRTKTYKVLSAIMTAPIPNYISEPRVLSALMRMETPDITSMTSMEESIVGTNMHEKVSGSVWYGRTTVGKKISTFDAHISMTKERRQLVETELRNLCNYDPLSPTVDLRTPAVYDKAEVSVEFDRASIPDMLMNYTYIMTDMVRQMQYPHTYINQMKVSNPEGKVSIHIKRPLYKEMYVVSSKTPRENTLISNIRVPDALVNIMPFTKIEAICSSSNQMQLRVAPSAHTKICRIQNNKIYTYDNVPYHYDPLRCWTMVTVSKTNFNAFQVYTRINNNRKLEVLIQTDSNRTVVQFSVEKVMINDKVMTSHHATVRNSAGTIVMDIYKGSERVEVMFHNKMHVSVTEEHILVIPNDRFRTVLRGLCGDFDGKTTEDLTGPKDCIYSNATLFKYAWAIESGEGCNTVSLRYEHERVREFQQHCPVRPSRYGQETSILTGYPTNCYKHVYPVKEHKSFICMSIDATKRCAGSCAVEEKSEIMTSAKCWVPSRVPSEVKQALSSTGYLRHPVSEKAEARMSVQFRVDQKCHKH